MEFTKFPIKNAGMCARDHARGTGRSCDGGGPCDGLCWAVVRPVQRTVTGGRVRAWQRTGGPVDRVGSDNHTAVQSKLWRGAECGDPGAGGHSGPRPPPSSTPSTRVWLCGVGLADGEREAAGYVYSDQDCGAKALHGRQSRDAQLIGLPGPAPVPRGACRSGQAGCKTTTLAPSRIPQVGYAAARPAHSCKMARWRGAA